MRKEQQSPGTAQSPTTSEQLTPPNGELPQLPPLGDAEAAALGKKMDLAAALLLPNPDTLVSAGEQIVVPVVSKLAPSEFFRTHPTLRLTLNLFTPNREDIDAHDYAVLPNALPLLARYRLQPSMVTLLPVVVGSKPLAYKLVRVKHPAAGRKWDDWNLSRRQALERAVHEWIALRSIPRGFEWVLPDPEAEFPEPVFPEWSENDWLQRSFGAQDLVLPGDENHAVFRALRGL
jgi:hypothetical protein